jgi:hypothetical protein
VEGLVVRDMFKRLGGGHALWIRGTSVSIQGFDRWDGFGD